MKVKEKYITMQNSLFSLGRINFSGFLSESYLSQNIYRFSEKKNKIIYLNQEKGARVERGRKTKWGSQRAFILI